MERAVHCSDFLAVPTYPTIFNVQNVMKRSWSLNLLHVLCLSEYRVCFSIFHRDGDGVPDCFDNCVDLPNGEQADVDDDKIGI